MSTAAIKIVCLWQPLKIKCPPTISSKIYIKFSFLTFLIYGSFWLWQTLKLSQCLCFIINTLCLFIFYKGCGRAAERKVACIRPPVCFTFETSGKRRSLCLWELQVCQMWRPLGWGRGKKELRGKMQRLREAGRLRLALRAWGRRPSRGCLCVTDSVSETT